MTYPICVLCKVKLDNPETYLFVCPTCNRQYILDYEVLEYADDVGTAYDDESATIETEGIGAASGPRLEIQEDELDNLDDDSDNDDEDDDGSIPIPDYMKSEEGREVIEYYEE